MKDLGYITQYLFVIEICQSFRFKLQLHSEDLLSMSSLHHRCYRSVIFSLLIDSAAMPSCPTNKGVSKSPSDQLFCAVA